MRILIFFAIMFIAMPAFAQNVIVLSTGSNYLGQSKTVLQSQIDSTVQSIKAKQPTASIVMVIPFQNMSAYVGMINGVNVYGGNGTTTIPSEAATAVATKYSIPIVTFLTSNDNIHPSNYNDVVQQIKNLTNVPSNKWEVVGDSIALAIASNVGASTKYAMNSTSPQYILDNFVSLLPQSTISHSNVNTIFYGGSNNKNIAYGAGVGLSYDVTTKHAIRLNIGYEQKTSNNPKMIFIGLTFIYKF